VRVWLVMVRSNRAVRVATAWPLLALLCLPALGQAPAAPAAGDAERSDYLIGPGDVLQLFVWKEPELTRELTVRIDGRVSVPLLGDVEAMGRTPAQLAADLSKRFTRFLEAPQVTLGVAQANSTRFFVLGQVNKPGDFPLTGRTTVLQGLALAGGFKEFAKTDSIVIIRREKGAETAVPFNYKRLESGKELAQNVALRPGDTVLVP
jgi:polysaccharide biosynthesis/export protein